MSITKCYICGGKPIKKEVSVENWWGETFTIIENVPAWVCEDCGEQYFDSETTLKLNALRKYKRNPTRFIQVPIYNYKIESSARKLF